MTRKLSDADREAVDLMFDRITSAAQDGNGGGDGFVAIADGMNGQRLQTVEEILNLLEAMPAATHRRTWPCERSSTSRGARV